MTQDDYVVMKKTSREKLIKELKEVKKENRQLKENYDRIYNEKCECVVKAIEILGQYKHYSVPTEKQNKRNEDIVDNAYSLLKGDLNGKDD